MRANFTTITIISLLFSSSLPAWGQNGTQVQGVVTQGLTSSTENNFFGDSADKISSDFREIALGFSTQLNSNLRLAGQGIIRSTNGSHESNVDFFLLDYSFTGNTDFQSGIRLGRFKNPLGLNNEARDIAFTRPSVLLPEPIYTENFRDLILSTDGIALYGTMFTENGEWSAEVGTGEARLEGGFQDLLFPIATATLDFSQLDVTFDDERNTVGRIRYDHNGGQWTVALSYQNLSFKDLLNGSIDVPFVGQIPVPNVEGKFDLDRFILSAQYEWPSWTLSGEFAQGDFEVDNPGLLSSSFTNEGYYVSLRRRITDSWTANLRWEEYFPDKDDKDGQLRTMGGQPSFSGFRKTIALGTRWDINENWLFMAELQDIDGIALISATDNPNFAGLKRKWNLLMMTLSYRF